jgi:hypothetical protein
MFASTSSVQGLMAAASVGGWLKCDMLCCALWHNAHGVYVCVNAIVGRAEGVHGLGVCLYVTHFWTM